MNMFQIPFQEVNLVDKCKVFAISINYYDIEYKLQNKIVSGTLLLLIHMLIYLIYKSKYN
jgi:hypothetical protein